MGFKTQPDVLLHKTPEFLPYTNHSSYHMRKGTALIQELPQQLYTIRCDGKRQMSVTAMCDTWYREVKARANGYIDIYVGCKDVRSRVPIQKRATQEARSESVDRMVEKRVAYHIQQHGWLDEMIENDEKQMLIPRDTSEISSLPPKPTTSVPKKTATTKKPRDKASTTSSSSSGTRVMKSTALPYTTGTTITLNGVNEPSIGCHPFIDLDRLTVSERDIADLVWPVLWEYIKKCEWPDDFTLYLDFDETGPYMIYKNRAYQLPGCHHPFGEADLMIPFWLRYLRYYPDILVDSNDSDLVLILLNYLHNVGDHHQHKSLYLQRSRDMHHAPATYYDMLGLYRCIGPMRMAKLNFLMPMLGTDYVKKDEVSHLIGGEFILQEAFCGPLHECHKEIDLSDALRGMPSLWDPKQSSRTWTRSYTEAKHTVTDTGDIVIQEYKTDILLNEVYRRLQFIRNELYRAYHRAKRRKNPIAASKTPMSKETLNSLIFNIQYWNPHWLSIVRHHAHDIELITQQQQQKHAEQ